MVLQDKYKRANSSRYRATHGGIQSNRQKARNQENSNQTNEFPDLVNNASSSTEKENHSAEATPTSQTEKIPTQQSFARGQLVPNIDRYLEPEPDPNQEPEPEVDLSNFLEKQRNQLQNAPKGGGGENNLQGSKTRDSQQDEDIDESFNHLYKHSKNHLNLMSNTPKKPTQVFIEDPNQLGLSELDEERKKADATRELIARFSGQTKLSNSTSKTQSDLKKALQQARFVNASSKKRCDNIKDQSSDELNKSFTPTDLVGPLDDEAFLDEVLNDSSGTYGKFKRT